MKIHKFAVPIYEVEVTLVQVESPADAEDVKAACVAIEMTEEDTTAVLKCINEDNEDGADTFRNFEIGKMCVIFYRMTDKRARKNRYGHEKRHVEDRILQWCGVNDIEAAGYLAGFLSEQFDELEQKCL